MATPTPTSTPNQGPGPRQWWYNVTTNNDKETNAFIKGSDGVLTTLDMTDPAGGGRHATVESQNYPDDNASPRQPTTVYTSEGDVVAMVGKPSGEIVVEKGDGDHVNVIVHRSLGVRSVRVSETQDIPIAFANDGLAVRLDLLGEKGNSLGTMLVRDETVRPGHAEPIIHQFRICDDDGTILASSEIRLNNKNAVDRVGQTFPIHAAYKVAEMEKSGFLKPTQYTTGINATDLEKIKDPAYEQWFAGGVPAREKEYDQFKKEQEAKKAAEQAKPAEPAKAAPESKADDHHPGRSHGGRQVPHHLRQQAQAASVNCTGCTIEVHAEKNTTITPQTLFKFKDIHTKSDSLHH